MKVIVPTLNVRAALCAPLTVGKHDYLPGAVVTLPYGVALQGIARGIVSFIVDADVEHAKAIELLGLYGGDSWFPGPLQTIGRVMAAYAQAETEAKTAIIH